MTRYHHLTRNRCRERLLAGWTRGAMRIGTTGSGQNDNDDNGAEQGGDSDSDNKSGRDTNADRDDRDHPAPSTARQPRRRGDDEDDGGHHHLSIPNSRREQRGRGHWGEGTSAATAGQWTRTAPPHPATSDCSWGVETSSDDGEREWDNREGTAMATGMMAATSRPPPHVLRGGGGFSFCLINIVALPLLAFV
jgi:hypothetical protein